MILLPTGARHFHVYATTPGAERLVLTFAQGLPAAAEASRLVVEATPAGGHVLTDEGHTFTFWSLANRYGGPAGTVALLACADPDCHHAAEVRAQAA